MVYKLLLFFVLLQSASLFTSGKKQLVAMDRIILANMGKGGFIAHAVFKTHLWHYI